MEYAIGTDVEVSYDFCETWHPARVVGQDGEYPVVVLLDSEDEYDYQSFGLDNIRIPRADRHAALVEKYAEAITQLMCLRHGWGRHGGASSDAGNVARGLLQSLLDEIGE